MTCEDARSLLDAHADRELDPAMERDVARHLSGCEQCSRELEAIRAIKTALSGEASYLRAPDALRRKIEEAIGSTAAKDRVATASAAERRARLFRWPAVAIPAAIAALLAILLMPRMFGPPEGDFLLREVVAAHVRSTQVDHLTDVASSDRHTVKPWFAGKIDFSPPVVDFQAQGFKLVGGRVDYLDDRAVAALVYQHGPHIINVFVWPSAKPDSSPAMTARSGYNIDRFAHAGMNYWIISDMSADEIAKLAALLNG